MTVQLRLPGQTAAHEGPVDMHMMYVMHHAFRRDLAAFAATTIERNAISNRRKLIVSTKVKTMGV